VPERFPAERDVIDSRHAVHVVGVGGDLRATLCRVLAFHGIVFAVEQVEDGEEIRLLVRHGKVVPLLDNSARLGGAAGACCCFFFLL
jgi:hypothetical protein